MVLVERELALDDGGHGIKEGQLVVEQRLLSQRSGLQARLVVLLADILPLILDLVVSGKAFNHSIAYLQQLLQNDLFLLVHLHDLGRRLRQLLALLQEQVDVVLRLEVVIREVAEERVHLVHHHIILLVRTSNTMAHTYFSWFSEARSKASEKWAIELATR